MRKFISYIAALCLSATSLFAQTSPYIGLNKTADYDYTTHTGIITLDSFVTGSVREIRTAIAADIILVLDCSSSMGDSETGGTRGSLVQAAACSFVDNMYTSAVNNSVDHKMGIITFGSGAHIRAEIQSVKDNKDALKAIINEPNPADGENTTRYDLAMLLVKNMLDGGTQYYDISTNTNASSVDHNYGIGYLEPNIVLNPTYCSSKTLTTPSGSIPIIVFLTDGEPTGKSVLGNLGQFYGSGALSTIDTPGNGGGGDASRYGNSSSWSTSDEFGIANHAIRTASYIKKTKNALIYSIQIGTPKSSGRANLAEDALTAISSKYPDATRYRQKYWGTAASGTEPYYQHITDINNTNISGAFTRVSTSVESVVSVQYGTETIMNDFINNTYFKLTNAVQETDPWSSIKVYKVRCTGLDTDGTTRTFGTAPTDTTRLYSTDGIIINIHKATTDGDNDQLKVSGFDYSANWCGMDGSNPHGYKLVVKVPFEFTGGDTQVPGTVQTNSSGSGIYPAKKDSDGNVIKDGSGNPVYESTPEEEYISPTITFCTLYITRDGLDRGESAIYEVTCDGKFVARVALNGTDDPSVDKYLYGLPGGSYVVTETGWNWAYDKKVWNGSAMVAGNSLTKTVNDPATPVQFRFGGSHKTGTGPEDRHNHDEEYKVNTIDVSGL